MLKYLQFDVHYRRGSIQRRECEIVIIIGHTWSVASHTLRGSGDGGWVRRLVAFHRGESLALVEESLGACCLDTRIELSLYKPENEIEFDFKSFNQI